MVIKGKSFGGIAIRMVVIPKGLPKWEFDGMERCGSEFFAIWDASALHGLNPQGCALRYMDCDDLG
jgi:hypothetical protein